jgi:hypothetical protein
MSAVLSTKKWVNTLFIYQMGEMVTGLYNSGQWDFDCSVNQLHVGKKNKA